jgi:peptide/nickel transport system permease protein
VTGAPAGPHRRAFRWLVALVLLVGAFAPLLANEVPLVARVGGHWTFPAFADLVGQPPPGPGDRTWKQWWARLPASSDDFAWMPPWPYGPIETNVALARAGPSFTHLLGCDDSGRDVLARLLHGTATVTWFALPAVLLAGVGGTLLGAWAALRRGVADMLVCRLIELFSCFPMLLYLLFASSFFGTSIVAAVVVLASLLWTSFARVVRGELLGLREREFVLVVRGLGLSDWRILTRHLLPQVRSSIGVTAAFCVAAAVVAESTLSFLGIGPGDTPSSWGTMLRHGANQAVLGAWHLWLFPALAIVAVVVACHVLADRLRS